MTFSSDQGQHDLEKELTRLRPATPPLPESFRLALRQRLRTGPVHHPPGEPAMKRLNLFAAAAALLVLVLLAGFFFNTLINPDPNPSFPAGQSGNSDLNTATPIPTLPATTPPSDWEQVESVESASTATPIPTIAFSKDSVWVESSLPPSGTDLLGPGPIAITVTVGYWIETVDEARLLVEVQRPNTDGSGYVLGETTATLPRGRGSLTLDIVIERPGEVGAEPRNVGLLITLWNVGAEKALFMDFPAGYEWRVLPDGE